MFGRLADHPIPLLVLIILVVVLFGWKRLPDAARSLGRSSRILKSEIDEMKAESSSSKASGETVQGEAQTRSDANASGSTPVDEGHPADGQHRSGL